MNALMFGYDQYVESCILHFFLNFADCFIGRLSDEDFIHINEN